MIYNFLRFLLYIPMKIVMIFSKKKREFLKKRLNQDFNFLNSKDDYIWLHCSSVGEINLSDALIQKILLERKERILISVFTDTGYETGKNKYLSNERIDIIYFPLDSKWELRKIFKRINFKLLILIETEIWPNFIRLASKRGKVIMVNGRISDKSLKKYLKLKKFLKKLFKHIDYFFMQTEKDAIRIEKIGADKDKIEVVGNLKFDIKFEDYTTEEKEELKELIRTDGRNIFVAGSIRTGEDEIIVDAFEKLKNYQLILVPRHLERIPKMEEFLRSKNLNFSKYSDYLSGKKEKSDILIVDKMGVLRKFYSIADVAFVGGTLVNIGGHSLLEPLFYRKTPIFGKYLQNVKDISEEILRREIGFKVEESKDIVLAVEEINSGCIKNEEIENFFKDNQNVASKLLKKIDEII